MTQNLSNKVAFVTGATSGLGRQFARALAQAGAAVAISGHRQDRLDALKSEIEATGGKAHAIPMDVTDISKFDHAIAHAEEALGPIWVLVNNSGVAVSKMIMNHTPEDYDHTMNVNVKAPYFLAQAAARAMIRNGNGGRIINIASIAAMKALVGNSAYCISKAATAHMTRCMALEWAKYNINVNAICPGYIRTEINDAFFSSEVGERKIAQLPKKRIGEDTDLNGLLLLLASEDNSFITGSLMVADDGQLLA